MKTHWAASAMLPIRLVLGISFIVHGWPKLFSSQGHEMFVGMLTGIGVPAPGITAWLVGLVEVVGGVALIIGAFVTLFSILLILDMLVAMFTVHIGNGYNWLNITGMGPDGPTLGMPGWELSLIYIAPLLTLL
ncbi:MAG: DoxX family protein, partial [Gemmatimonadaceae bacterium]